MPGIYFHIPFCKQACHYCDFHFSTDRRGHEEMVTAMVHELELQQSFLSGPVETVYFGGGTPSILTSDQLGKVIETARSRFDILPDAEITLEANPDDLSRNKLQELRHLGVNRLSIGIQSFRNEVLAFLHRAHNAESAIRCLDESREAGFSNISLDLIYGIPGLGLSEWEATLQEALKFQPAHLSMYALTIEERTVFGNWAKRRKLIPTEEETVARQFELMQDVLEGAGYDHYEISNFCLPGRHSRHNSSYWLQQAYLGIGPSAHSYDGTRRYSNISNNARYVKAIGQDQIPAETELLSRENKINEYILTRLRTRWGCDLDWLRRELQDDLLIRHGERIAKYVDMGLLTIRDNVLQLSRKGRLLADQITEDLLYLA